MNNMQGLCGNFGGRGVIQKLRQKYTLYFSEERFPDTQNFKIRLDAPIDICLKLWFSEIGIWSYTTSVYDFEGNNVWL